MTGNANDKKAADSVPYGSIEAFLEGCHFGFAILNTDLRYLYVNRRYANIHEISLEKCLGRTLQEVRSDVSDQELSAFKQLIEKKEPIFGLEIQKQDKNSTDANYWNMNFYPIKSPEGKLLHIATTIRNTTKLKLKGLEVEEKLQFEVLLSQLSSNFINLSTEEIDSKIRGALKAIVDFLGFDRGSINVISKDQSKIIRTHQYSLPGVAMSPDETPVEMLPQWLKTLHRGKVTSFSSIDEIPELSHKEKNFCASLGFKSLISIPMIVGGTVLGAVLFTSSTSERKWSDDIVRRLRLVGEILANAIERKRSSQRLEQAFLEISELKDRLEAENIYLRDEIEVLHKHEEIIGQSDAICKVLKHIEQVASLNSTVLITGETGTGKELVARAIHNLSPRKDKTMVKVNCAALPSTLIESELFGREKGAFTGALTKQIGRFEAANGSTIFLDEVGDLPLELQAKLLRVLQEGQFERLGSNQTINVDVRVVAATNRDLAQSVKEGKFREDLYYRLNVFPVYVPPLRERREDIPLMVWAFVKEFSKSMGKTIESVHKSSMHECHRYHWPGNVRELRNVIERAMIVCTGPVLRIELPHSKPDGSQCSADATTLEDVERQHILSVVESTGWRIRGQGGAAEILGLKPTTLDSKMLKLGIKRKWK